jgi:putative transposase
VIFHVLNRANARARIFEKDLDYEAFSRVIAETANLIPVEIFAYTVMPTHWHMVLRPTRDGDLGNFVQRLTTTHFLPRFCLISKKTGQYVKQNPLRAGLVQRAEDWRWSSLHARQIGAAEQAEVTLSEWPVPKPIDWVSFVNHALTLKELEELRLSVQRGRPFGSERWKTGTAKQLALQSTMRPRGRPHGEI